LCGSTDRSVAREPQLMEWAPYIVSDSVEDHHMCRWTSFSGLSSDSEDEPTTPDGRSGVPEGALWMRRTASIPLAN
jgi:hypothetical protein